MADRPDAPNKPDVPDLDLPPPRPSSAKLRAPKVSSPPSSGQEPPASGGALGGSGDDFGMEIERTPAVSSPPASMRQNASKQIAIDLGSGGDAFDMGMEIERGGGFSLPPSSSGRPSGPVSAGPSPQTSARPGSGLEIAYRRSDLQRRAAAPAGPTFGEKILAHGVTVAPGIATLALLVKLAHRHGGRSFTSLLPHAFDASSTIQSGAFALVALAVAIGIGVFGVKANPRSYAMIGSAATLLIASLAMVTVTLVSTEENPTPPDGALLIPYVMPLALFLLGVGVAYRGVGLFLDGGGPRRAVTALLGAASGALVFAAIELSALAARLP